MRHKAEVNSLQQDMSQSRKDYMAIVERLQRRAQETISMSRLLVDIQRKERLAIGREMHDELGQYLTAIRIKSFSLRKRLGAGHPREVLELDAILDLIHHVNTWIRGLIRRLNPVDIQPGGLKQILEILAGRFSNQFGVRAKLSYKLEESAVDGLAAEQLYFIAQEAMQNAVRHGKANSIAITVKMSRGREALMIVENNGAPFVITPGQRGEGLSIMKQRAEIIGGALEIVSGPGGGARVSCRFGLLGHGITEAGHPGETTPCRFCRYSPSMGHVPS
jgi:signal transduction histidine kinase